MSLVQDRSLNLSSSPYTTLAQECADGRINAIYILCIICFTSTNIRTVSKYLWTSNITTQLWMRSVLNKIDTRRYCNRLLTWYQFTANYDTAIKLLPGLNRCTLQRYVNECRNAVFSSRQCTSTTLITHLYCTFRWEAWFLRRVLQWPIQRFWELGNE